MDALDRGKAHGWVLEHVKPEASLQPRMTTLKLSDFGQGSSEKTGMLGKNKRQQEKRRAKHEMD